MLRFKKLPDLESPVDADTNNVYSVTVNASDGAGTPTVRTLNVTVTVTQVDEAGKLTLSSSRPRLGTAVTATVFDPEGVTGQTTWRWERSSGRSAWNDISGATAGSYTPTAVDAGHFLRATATYTDSQGAGKSVQATASEVVLAYTLSNLTITTTSTRNMYPAFNSATLHYAVGCIQNASLTLTLSTTETNTRLAVNGIQRGQPEREGRADAWPG